MNLFLASDLKDVEDRIAEYRDRLSEANSGIHETTTQSTETWHDNPAFDEQQQQSKMWRTEERKLRFIVSEAEVVSPPAETDTVTLGTIVSVRNTRSGACYAFEIGSYMNFTADEDRISYISPVGAALMGKSVGDKAKVEGRPTEYEVVSISLATLVQAADEKTPALSPSPSSARAS